MVSHIFGDLITCTGRSFTVQVVTSTQRVFCYTCISFATPVCFFFSQKKCLEETGANQILPNHFPLQLLILAAQNIQFHIWRPSRTGVDGFTKNKVFSVREGERGRGLAHHDDVRILEVWKLFIKLKS